MFFDVPSPSRIVGVALATILCLILTFLGEMALAQKDKYSLEVPGGLAFSEFKGYEDWRLVSVSRTDKAFAATLANPEMIEAFLAGVPDNGKPFPDGVKMAKIHWIPKSNAFFPETSVPGPQHDVDFMVKDSKRFADSGGWGWAAFAYDAATSTFRPGNEADEPPQAHDAKCGFECHTIVEKRDYVFTEYATR